MHTLNPAVFKLISSAGFRFHYFINFTKSLLQRDKEERKEPEKQRDEGWPAEKRLRLNRKYIER